MTALIGVTTSLMRRMTALIGVTMSTIGHGQVSNEGFAREVAPVATVLLRANERVAGNSDGAIGNRVGGSVSAARATASTPTSNPTMGVGVEVEGRRRIRP